LVLSRFFSLSHKQGYVICQQLMMGVNYKTFYSCN
jgi:hypothetical protein